MAPRLALVFGLIASLAAPRFSGWLLSSVHIFLFQVALVCGCTRTQSVMLGRTCSLECFGLLGSLHVLEAFCTFFS